MSWSICLIGEPDKIAEALASKSEKMEGQSKVEFDDALPHMQALVKQNFGNEGTLVKLTASGHGYAVDGVQKNRTFSAAIELNHGVVVV